MPYTSYDHTTDPTAFLIFDDRSTFTTVGGVGTQVTAVSNVSASGKNYVAVPDHGTGVTLASDGTYNYLAVADSSLKVVSSTAFDEEFTGGPIGSPNTTPSGFGAFIVFEAPDGAVTWLIHKAPDRNQNPLSLSLFNPGFLGGYVQANQQALCHRPYHGGWATACQTNEFLTNYTGGAGDNGQYRDGLGIYYNGAPSTKTHIPTGAGGPSDPTATVGHDLIIGGNYPYYLNPGAIRAVVLWNRTPLHHEILATDRYYRARYGLPETLTNQPLALIAESNSESVYCQSDTEPGVYDRAIVALGATTDACFMLGLSGRSGAGIVNDYATWTAPLIAYLRSLGMPVAVNLWELINDGYAPIGPQSYVAYWNLVKDSGAKFSVETVFASSTYTRSDLASGTNPICTANAQVIADAATYGYAVGLLGEDATLGTYSSTYVPDGLHWEGAAIPIGAPYFVSAIRASLAAAFSVLLFCPLEG